VRRRFWNRRQYRATCAIIPRRPKTEHSAHRLGPANRQASSAHRLPGSDSPIGGDGAPEACDYKQAISPLGSRPSCRRRISAASRRSDCEVYAELILAKIDANLSAQRIWQDLTAEHGITSSCYSVKRFVRRFDETTPLPFRRMECAAGEEAQVDFGTGAPIVGTDGKRRKTYVFRIVMSHSREGYCNVTFTQCCRVQSVARRKSPRVRVNTLTRKNSGFFDACISFENTAAYSRTRSDTTDF
jgi:hypothetical protein